MKTRYYQSLTKSNSFSFVKDKFSFHLLFFGVDAKGAFSPGSGWGGGETRHMKGVGTLVVSLRGVNLGFWSHLACYGQNAIIFRRQHLV